MSVLAVTDFLRRSPVARAVPANAVWSARNDAAVLSRVGDADVIGGLAIADLSPLHRLGFKGRGTIPAMKARGIAVNSEPNRAFRQPDGGLCLVLGEGEVLLLGSLINGNDALAGGWDINSEECTYPVPRRDSHTWFTIIGTAAADMFAKLCGVDLRPHKFADLAVAQTSVARLHAIVTRADLDGQLSFHLLADSASAVYLLHCLLDAAEEFGGNLIGLDALRPRP